MSKQIKVLGPGCPKCKTTFHNVEEAVKQLGIEAEIIKIEDIEEMMAYNVLTTPVLMIDEVIKIKGRIAQTNEIIELLKDFIELSGKEEVGEGTIWRIVIHITFVISGVLFALMDFIADKREAVTTHSNL